VSEETTEKQRELLKKHPKNVNDWFELLASGINELEVAGALLASLEGGGTKFRPYNTLQVINLMTACKLYQLSRQK